MKHRGPRLRQGEVWPAEVLRLAEADGAEVQLQTPDGLARARVPGAVPGDQLQVRVRHVGQHMAWGQIAELEAPSPERVEAPCPLVLRCGGCPWQMVDLDTQRQVKQAELAAELAEIGDAAVWHPWQPSRQRTGYRTRALQMARRIKGRLELGFFAPGSDDLVAVDACVVQHPLVDRALRDVRTVLDRAGMTTWRDAQRPGQLRAVLYRLDPGADAGLLTLVVTHTLGLTSLAPDLLAIPGISGVFANLQTAAGGAVLGAETVHIAGEARQRVHFAGTALEAGPVAFLQTRQDAADCLVQLAAGHLPQNVAHLVDLYAGIGAFGLSLRARCAQVTLVERDPAATADAAYNVAKLGADNVDVVTQSAEDFAPQLASLHPDAVLLDPPRAGCDGRVLAALAELPSAATLLYVSCNGKSLARDLRVLAAQGWKLEHVHPVDMFPHTPHAEWLVKLSRS